MKKRLLFVLLLLFSVLLVACKDDEVKFTVTFNSNGGSNVESIEVVEGELAPRPTDPTKDNYIFDGWFKEQALSNEWKWTEDKVTSNITLYARWKEDTSGQVGGKVKVTFNFNYSGSSAPQVVEIDKGTKVTNVPEVPTRADFAFVGWSTSRNEFVEFDLDALVNVDVIVYAIWESTKEVHTVTVDFAYDNKTETFDIVDGELLELEAPTREGYLFLGWLKGEESFDLETPITENITLVANWILDDSGLEGEPITNAAQLLELFRTGGSGTYYLATDIEMSDVEFEGSLGSGDNAVTFSGILDGNGKRIKNFNVTTTGNKSAAMFGILDGATIRNLIIMRSSIYVPGEAAGFVSAYVRGKTTFENLTFVNVTTDSSGSYAGLLYADNQNNESAEPVTIKNIVVVNDSDHEIKAGRYVGALVGHLRHQQLVNIENVFIKSIVKVGQNSTAGALVGRIQNADVELNINNAYFEGEVFATNYVGGLIGEANTTAKIDIKNVLINNSLIHSSGSTADLLIGRRGELDLTIENVFYSDALVFRNDTTEVPVNLEEATLVEVTETWFNDSVLNKEFFDFVEEKITHKVDLGPKVAERLTISQNSYNNLFIKGVDEELDLSNLVVSVAYSDGSTSLIDLEDLSIDKTSFDKDVVGKYIITVTFEGLEGKIEINVVEVTEIVVHTYDIDRLFLVNKVDLSKVVVHAILGDGSHIILDNEELDIDYVAETVGQQNVKVTYKEEFDVEFPITIVGDLLVATDGVVEVVVDHELTGVSGASVEGIVHVKTVKEAINLIEKSQLEESVIKKINIKNGLYFEKIRIATPNVHLIGESQEDTIIEYDRASGHVKPQGGEWGTQGSATVTISSAARGFIAHNLTFSNSFDYYGSTVGNKQAVALVNEADRALYYKVSFKGLQDTLYAKNGRQWYLDVYVEGIVDYIFGNGGPAFFENSVIHTLKREDTNANAVITANQGLGSSASDVIKYGYVFYNNTLTADEGVLDGSVDLGRPWRQDSAVTFIDNIFGSFISEAGWVEMSGNKPEDANYFEFGNKIGETEYQSTIGTQLTAEEADVYRNKDIIFATTNGDVTFNGEWDYLGSLAMIDPNYDGKEFVTVTYMDKDEVYAIKTIFKGDLAPQIKEPVFGDIEFLGWQVDGIDFNFDVPVESNVVLNANWAEGELLLNYELHDELNTDDFFTATTSRITDMPAYELADGTIITKAIKFDSSGQISFTTDVPGLMLELHIRTRKVADTGARVSIDGEIFDVSNTETTIITLTLAEAKEYVIKRDNKELGVYYVRVYTDDSVTFELHDELNTDDFFTATTGRITDMPAYELIDGTIITKAIKFDSSGQISFTTDVPGLILELHIRTRKVADTGARVSVDGEIFDVSNTEVTVIRIRLEEAKEYIIKRDNKELGVYYVKVTSKGEILDKVFHNVTFMDGDTQLNVIEVEEGKLITGQTNPTKDGYKFIGWLLDDVIFDLTNNVVTEELVLVAKWEEIVYHSVKFMDGELEIENLQVEDGKLVSAISEPTKEGFIFVHWALDDQEFDFETAVTTDLVLVAVWEDIDNITFHTVTFMDGENKLEELDVEDGKLITDAPNPTKEGFVLTGWELNGEAFTLDTPVTADLVLVAVWEESANVPVGTPISTVAEFMEFLNQTSGDYYLANDIDFTGVDPLTSDEKKTFTGTLDGNFKTISNLTRTTERGGLFRSIKGATFKNITFDNVTMIGTNRAGMIAGEAPKDDNTSTIENIIIINSSISGAANNGVSAIIGMGQSNLIINNIKVIDTNISNSEQAAGAVIGQIDGAYNITLSNIFIQNVDIEASSRVGAVYGESKNGAVITINNVIAINTDLTSAGSNVAVVSGYHNVDGFGLVSNVFFNGTIEGTTKVGHVVSEKTLESFSNVFISETTITGTVNGTTLNEENILEVAPNQAWWEENLVEFTTNDLWEFDSTLNVYKLK